MENCKWFGWIRRLGRGVIALVYGIPAAWADKERAEAMLKWIDCHKQFLRLMRNVGFSKEEQRRFLTQIMMTDRNGKIQKARHNVGVGAIKQGKMNTEVRRLMITVAKLTQLMEMPPGKRGKKWPHDICIVSRLVQTDMQRLCREWQYLRGTVASALKTAENRQLNFESTRSLRREK